MGNSISTAANNPPYPIRAAPLSYGGLFLNLGMQLNCLAIDTAPVGDENKLLDIIGGYYFRRAIVPSSTSTILKLLGAVVGTLYYTRNLVGTVTTNASPRRKRSDILGFRKWFLFLIFHVVWLF